MKSPFLKRAWRLGRWFIAGFMLLFVFRMIVGYVSPSAASSSSRSGFFDGIENIRKNYASEKFSMPQVKMDAPHMNSNVPSPQKYEKTAEVTSRSSNFEKDGHAIRSKTADFHGMVQYEHADGLKGARELHLVIGVHPEKFDTFYAVVCQIGEIRSMSVEKVDKTNEYAQLNARKASLEKTLASLMELKTKGGEIGDFVSLHDKILETETKLQELGVQLDDFNADNEYCTVKFSLFEGRAKQGISILHRMKTALEWTVQYNCILLGIVFLGTLSVFILLLIIDKLKIMQIVKGND
ncbi:DUF4349 domain-containing protein [Chitinophaga sp. NPDC101104]|uniref:DUF4349 domain-containing protein n=1 Tax=Chitinophaga sp. NPDC101104 TaxID=3390561 RepID=UPI003CFE7049